jgi:hypothetical protein
MPGVELATAIGIAASFAACLDFATKVYDRAKKKREAARVLRMAEELGHTLQGGHAAIEAELARLERLGHVFGGGHGM